MEPSFCEDRLTIVLTDILVSQLAICKHCLGRFIAVNVIYFCIVRVVLSTCTKHLFIDR